MKKLLFILLLFTLFSFHAHSQTNTVFTDTNGIQFRILQDWTLTQENGNWVTGELEGTSNTPSFYWQLIRSERKDIYGNYSYFLYFYSNALSISDYGDPILKDVLVRDLKVVESLPNGYLREVYSTPIYVVDRSGDKIISWFTNVENPYVNFTYSNAYQKMHYDRLKTNKSTNGGY